MTTIERLKELEENTSDCYPEVMTFVAEMRRTLPALLAALDEAAAVLPAVGSLFADGRDLQKALEALGYSFDD